jgi:hypothetical protein
LRRGREKRNVEVEQRWICVGPYFDAKHTGRARWSTRSVERINAQI